MRNRRSIPGWRSLASRYCCIMGVDMTWVRSPWSVVRGRGPAWVGILYLTTDHGPRERRQRKAVAFWSAARIAALDFFFLRARQAAEPAERKRKNPNRRLSPHPQMDLERKNPHGKYCWSSNKS